MEGSQMSNHRDLPIDLLVRTLRYDPDSGLLYWRERKPDLFTSPTRTAEWECARWNSRYSGELALNNIGNHGYRNGKIMRVPCLAHRAVMAMSIGRWPENVDHINRDRSDNRLANLRECTAHQNSFNRTSVPGASSKYLGVSRLSRIGKWQAEMGGVQGRIYLGVFESEDDAGRAYDAAARLRFGEFANLNFPDERTNQ